MAVNSHVRCIYNLAMFISHQRKRRVLLRRRSDEPIRLVSNIWASWGNCSWRFYFKKLWIQQVEMTQNILWTMQPCCASSGGDSCTMSYFLLSSLFSPIRIRLLIPWLVWCEKSGSYVLWNTSISTRQKNHLILAQKLFIPIFFSII